jgi:hypothetical protein
MTTRIKMKPAALAAAFLFASTAALAGPGPAFGKGAPGAAGGPPPGPGMMIEQAIVELKDKLALDTSQQVQWQAAIDQTRAGHEQARAAREAARAKVDAELANAEPDLAVLATLFDATEEQNRALRKQTRDTWLRLYAGMRADQKAIVRDAIKLRLDRVGPMRERMHGAGFGRSPS